MLKISQGRHKKPPVSISTPVVRQATQCSLTLLPRSRLSASSLTNLTQKGSPPFLQLELSHARLTVATGSAREKHSLATSRHREIWSTAANTLKELFDGPFTLSSRNTLCFKLESRPRVGDLACTDCKPHPFNLTSPEKPQNSTVLQTFLNVSRSPIVHILCQRYGVELKVLLLSKEFLRQGLLLGALLANSKPVSWH